MQMLMTRLKGVCKSHLVAVLLVALAITEVISLAALIETPSRPDTVSYRGEEQGTVAPQTTLRISDIRGPRIDDEAAMIVVEESPETALAAQAVSACSTLPVGIWVFLVAAYVALLIFNFSYTFRQAREPQWFWEALYTFLAIVGWYSLDDCRAALWFPFAIVKFGLIVFALYAYLLEKKLSAERELMEKTESMF